MSRKPVAFHRGGVASYKARGANAFSREKSNFKRWELTMWPINRGVRYLDGVRNPSMRPLLHKGGKP